MLKEFKEKLYQEHAALSLWYFVSFIFGIILIFSNIIFQGKIILITLVILALGLLLSMFFIDRTEKYWSFFTIVIGFYFILGGIAANFKIHQSSNFTLNSAVRQNIIGEVVWIKPKLNGLQIVVKPHESEHKISLKISDQYCTKINVGDTIELKAKIFPLQKNILPGSYDFGFFQKLDGIVASGFAVSDPIIKTGSRNRFDVLLGSYRLNIYHELIRNMGPIYGNFTSAILIGETRAIPDDIANAMRQTGVSHILCVSGLHLTLVAAISFLVFRVLLNLSTYVSNHWNIKSASGFFAIIISFLYLLISGSNIAATRAFIMTSIFMVAVIIERKPYPLRSVMIAAFFILLYQPHYVFHPSFQLSFAAVLCLISGYEFYLRHQNIFSRSKGILSAIKFYFITNIYSSILASIATAPFIIYHFYKFPVYSILMNLIAVPIMSFIIMPLGLILLFSIPIGGGEMIMSILSFFIKIIIGSAMMTRDLPGSVLSIGSISPIALFIFSIGFLWLVIWRTKKIKIWGLVPIIFSAIIVVKSSKPVAILDLNRNFLAIYDKNSKNLKIYSDKKPPEFVTDYYVGWYGADSLKSLKKNIFYKNNRFKLPNGKWLGFSYHKCQKNVDINIVTSKIIICPKIPNQQLIFLKNQKSKNHILIDL